MLDIWTQDSKPIDWARTKNNLGNSYASLGDRNTDYDKWNQAASAFRDALEEWTRDDGAARMGARQQQSRHDAPHASATTTRTRASSRQAVEAYRLALEEWTRERVPFDWAIVQNNLGNALTDLAKLRKDEAGVSRRASRPISAALEELAARQGAAQLGDGAEQSRRDATRTLGRLREGRPTADRTAQAVDAYQLCLQERTKDRDPRMWALTQYNLGLVLTDLARVEDGTAALAAGGRGLQRVARGLRRRTIRRSTGPMRRTGSAGCWRSSASQRRRRSGQQGREAMQASFEFYRDYDGAAPYFEERLAQIDEWLTAVS